MANSNPFRFGYDSVSGKYGYILPDGEGGADTLHPFSGTETDLELTVSAYSNSKGTTCLIIKNQGWKRISNISGNRWICENTNVYSVYPVNDVSQPIDISNFEWLRIRVSTYGDGSAFYQTSAKFHLE